MSLILRHVPAGEERGLRSVLEGEYALPEGFDPGPTPIVLDIGANVGAFTLWALHQWPGATIFAYEPNPETFKLLEANVGDSGQVTCRKCAVWLADGKMPLYLPKPGLPSGCASLKDTGEVDLSKAGIVKVVHARNLPPCDVLKLDTEGCELDILRTYPHLTGCKAVVLEWHSHSDRVAIRDLMGRAGFDLVADTEWHYLGRGIQKFTQSAKKHLFVSVLSGGGKTWAEHNDSIMGLQRLAPSSGINLSLAKDGGTGVDRARNRQVALALSDPTVTHFIFIDDDIVFDPQWVVNMVNSGLDVVGGAYPRKQIDWEQVSKAAEMGVKGEELAAYSTSFIFNTLVDNNGGANARSFPGIGDFVEVEEIGTGFLMIRREVLEKMLAEYGPNMAYITDYPPRGEVHHMMFSCGPDPACELERAKAAVLKAAAKMGGGWYCSECGRDHQTELVSAAKSYQEALAKGPAAISRFLTEDYRWCRLWRMLGGKIYLYINAEVEHLGVFKFTGKISRVLKKATDESPTGG